MRLNWPSVAAIALTGLCVFPNLAFAGYHFPHSRRLAPAQSAPKGATAKFSCETRFFNVSLNTAGMPPCYSPQSIRAAYGIDKLIGLGNKGSGQTIVILDAFGSPTAQADLWEFDAKFGLPNPPSFNIVNMPGVQPFDNTDPNQIGWAQEVSLDVQWSHAMAPNANIVLVVAPSNSDEDLLAALNFAINKRLGDIISMSFGESEAFLTDAAGQAMVQAWEKALQKARNHHITVLASSGDEGSTNAIDEFGDVLTFQNVNYPASSPNVTAVGGTNLMFGVGGKADPNGKYIGETVWNDEPQGFMGAGGGGVSMFFRRPEYQRHLGKSVREALNGRRGIPDVSINAGIVGGVVVKFGFLGAASGFYIVGGTSAGSVEWAGVVADLNQALNGGSLGFLNNKLYHIGRRGLNDHDGGRPNDSLFHDITVGNNGFCGFDADTFDVVCVDGFAATPGWDLATGWGTPNLKQLAKLLDDLCNDDDDHDRR
jgi:subtilase family serine protease